MSKLAITTTKYVIIFWFSLLLISCKTINYIPWEPKNNLINKNWSFTGKISMVYNNKAKLANIIWQHNFGSNKIKIFSNISNETININFDANSASLIINNTVYTHTNIECLIKKHFGASIPFTELASWVLGEPNNSSSFKIIKLNDNYNIEQFKQQNWTINYQAYQSNNNYMLPKRFSINHDSLHKLTIKLAITNWNILI